jgi:porphobilinogen synthase
VFPRRLRHSAAMRELFQETRFSVKQLIYPLFIIEGTDIRREISSMPGQFQFSVDRLEAEILELVDLGISSVLLFGIPNHKDEKGSENWNPQGIIPQAIQEIKRICPTMLVITDVCCCEYTTHGHCGILSSGHTHLPDGYVLNDETLAILADVALVHAQAGADMVAPSAMMDGQVKAIRQKLDGNGFSHLPIFSYTVKYASAYYGPFREAAQGAPQFGDRKTHQMNIGNVQEALKEAELDILEGADVLMVKPALAYLDVIRAVKTAYPHIPLGAYNVSGEYAMVKAAAEKGWLDEKKIVMENLTAIFRAGADVVITYHAKSVMR